MPRTLLIEISWKFDEAAAILKRVRSTNLGARCVFVTFYPNIASAVKLIKLGADNYLSKSMEIERLIGEAISASPSKIPDVPMNPERLFWEYLHSMLMRNGHNVSETARVLRMHRRTLQRILSKTAPPESPEHGIRKVSPR